MSEEIEAMLKSQYINLASPKVGSEVTFASDDFFADKSRLLKDSEPVFIDDKYDDHGKWMDGWESRRRRHGDRDYCYIKLGITGIIKGVDIDTSFFTGNYPPYALIEACLSDGETPGETEWHEIVPKTALGPDNNHIILVDDDAAYNWLRLTIFPDGGVARLRVYGEAHCQWESCDQEALYELSSLANGGRIVGFNNAHYGNVWSLLCGGRGENMGDGWETRRRREPGNDWIVLALGTAGLIEKIEVDTAYFKGNFPDGFSLQAASLGDLSDDEILAQAHDWKELMTRHKLSADNQHYYSHELSQDFGPVTHIRMNIYPDGGVSRFRAWGRITDND